MADNYPFGTGLTGAADDIGGVHFGRQKITIGADGVNDGDVAKSNPLPVGATQVAATNGLTSSRVNAAASTNATSLKGSAGRIAQIDVFNVATSSRFLKLYNKASAPTVGTDTPIWTIPLPANSGFSASFPFGKYFATGIAYAITGLQADSDTTAVAAGDVTGSIDWV